MSKKISVLEMLGFDARESEVYKTMLVHGPSSISDLQKYTGIHRPTMYAIVKRLMDRELVSIQPKGKQKLYVAAPPERIRHALSQASLAIESEITELEESYKTSGSKPIVTYSEGGKAITAAFSDMVHSLKRGETYYRYSSANTLNRETYVPKDYRKVRDQKQLERLVITNEPTRRLHTNQLGRIVKAVPPQFDLFDYNIAQIMYKDKVSILDYNTKSVITIQNKKFAEFQKKIFKLLFSKL
jgi:DNA-binding transcriptional regulator GbsR (MarR family)